jgi:tungstate transport system substrate-binding protein
MNRNTSIVIAVTLVCATVMGGIYVLQSKAKGVESTLVVSTTTSLYDTGVLDEIEEAFEAEHSIDLYFISVGTGLAITHAMRGDADMILVHAPSKELSFLEEGYGVNRKIIAYNFFAIVGPDEDPAGIAGMSPKDALNTLVGKGRAGEALWVSRGDDSGTHTKEKVLWSAAGLDASNLRDEGWYREAGAGMGKTLQIAKELDAYTLSDMGTYLKYRTDGLIFLEVCVGEGEELINVYSAIAVNPESNDDANFDDANTFIEFLISDKGQSIFDTYGVDIYGRSLFKPAVQLLNTTPDETTASWIAKAAFFDGSECPIEYRAGNRNLYD